MAKIYPSLLVLCSISCFAYLLSTPLRAQSVEDIDRLRNKAEKLYTEGDYSQALICYLDGYHRARKLDNVRAANLTVDISSIYHMQGNYRWGATICQEGVTLLNQATTQSDSVWFKLNSSLGEMYKKLNNQDSCYLYFSRANAILYKQPGLENQISDYVIYHYNNQGMMYVRNGAYTEGLSYLTKALTIAQKHTSSKENIAILQNNLGEVYEQLGLFERALEFRKLAVRLYPKNDLYKYRILNGISWNALQSHHYQEAYNSAKQALKLYQLLEKTEATNAEFSLKALSLYYLGGYYYSIKNYKKADFYYDLIINHPAKTVSRIYIISKLGKAYIQQVQTNLPAALTYCEQVINASQHSAKDDIIWQKDLFEAQTLKATLLIQQFQKRRNIDDVRLALTTYLEALDIADAMRKRYNELETKWFFTTQVRPAYLHAFETAYSLFNHTHQPVDRELAFSLLERSKATALADITRELLIKPANVPAGLLTKERDLQRTITLLELESTATLSPKLVDTQIQLAQLQQRFDKEFPAYYRAKYKPQTVSIKLVQKTIDTHTAYLSYLLTQNELYIAVVTRDGLSIVRKNGNLNALKTALKTLDTALHTNPGLGNYTGTPAASIGYRWLIEPVAHLLKHTDRLIISPDGDLHRLPFEVLETNRVIDDFLIKQYAISYIPSANALIHQVPKAATNSENSLLSLAPFVEPDDAKAPPLSLPYLPASQAEVEQLPGEAVLGKAATKRRFMRSYLNINVLHFATHAYANNTEPARSYIAFYPDGGPDKLYAGEIYNLLLPHTRLVMLSACETGNGKLQPGEGVISLAQAFAYAGCPSVVSTLWSANDESTAYLAQRVYTHLHAGLPIDVALQRTRLDYFQSALYLKQNHPHYWANLVLIGNAQPVYATPWPVTGTLSLIIGLVMCLGVAWISWQRGLFHTNRVGQLGK